MTVATRGDKNGCDPHAEELRRLDRFMNSAPLDEVLSAIRLSEELKAAISVYKTKARVRRIPLLGSLARALYRLLRGGAR